MSISGAIPTNSY